MKVLGCYIRDIKKLFLFEAGIIGFIGGLMGVGLSYLFSHLLNKYGGKFFLPHLHPTAPFIFYPSLFIASIALIFVARLAGRYPENTPTIIATTSAVLRTR